jgi:uncharacterized protein (DUF2252 family)
MASQQERPSHLILNLNSFAAELALYKDVLHCSIAPYGLATGFTDDANASSIGAMSALPTARQRDALLQARQNQKMARSPHRYVRGTTRSFYTWLAQSAHVHVPEGPSIWICGDCHVGNIGPLSDDDGRITLEIRDLDQTVIGNPAHDLLRLGLSLASAVRGSNAPGVTTARMLEAMIDGYEQALASPDDELKDLALDAPEVVKSALRRSRGADWTTLARDRIEDVSPTIPLGKRFWPLSRREDEATRTFFESGALDLLVTRLKHRDDDADVRLLDAAYWVKGCSSLGLLRLALLLEVRSGKKNRDLCIIDVKEAVKSVSPPSPLHKQAPDAKMPRDQAQRVVAGAKALSPALGERMIASQLLGRSVFIRELLPQDLKLEIDALSRKSAIAVARYLAAVVGHAHARQMDAATRKAWLQELRRNPAGNVEAPSWLWLGVVEMLAMHERAYLEHCRNFAAGA